MNKLLLVFECLLLISYQTSAQCLQRQLEAILESPRTRIPNPYPIIDIPCPGQSTTIITDSSPSTCKNLANTLQLLIVSNLLQNTNGGQELALQLAAPLINELFSSPTLSCGCANPFAAGAIPAIPSYPPVIPPNIYPQTFVPSNIYPQVIPPAYVSPNPAANNINIANLISSLAGSLGPGYAYF